MSLSKEPSEDSTKQPPEADIELRRKSSYTSLAYAGCLSVGHLAKAARFQQHILVIYSQPLDALQAPPEHPVPRPCLAVHAPIDLVKDSGPPLPCSFIGTYGLTKSQTQANSPSLDPLLSAASPSCVPSCL
jgi:hypothetical protein